MGLGARAIEQAWLRCAFNVAVVNCDDHTKNLAFLMDASGQWRLAPAFDMCFAHNPRPDRWTHKHQMLVRGKAWDITGQDLIELGTEFGVNQPRILLERIGDVVRRWPEFAKDAGVPAITVSQIAALQPSLKAIRASVRRTTTPASKTRRERKRGASAAPKGKRST